MMIFAFLFLAKLIYCEEISYGTFTKASGNFIDNTYLSTHQVSQNEFTYSSSGDYNDHPISLAFDSRNSNTYWVSEDPINETQPSYILLNFTDTIALEGFVYDLSYRSRDPNRFFDGAPLELNVYSSKNNGPLTLRHFFNGTYDTRLSANWDKIQFVFESPIECDSLKIEFLKVTLDESFSNTHNAVVRNLLLVSYINESLNVAIAGAKDNYANGEYVAEHKVSTSYFTYRSSGDNPQYPITNLFDDVATSYWVSKDPNQDSFKNYLIINFKGSITLEGFLYDTAYRTSGQHRDFDGFPTKLKVFTSSNDEKYKLAYQFIGTPIYPWTRIQFIFPELVQCDKIKLEFTTVTTDVSFGNKLTACCAGLTLIQHISDEYQAVMDEINNIFTDYVQLTLNESYTPEKIEQLRQKSMQFASYETEIKPIFDRIEAINKGTIKKDPHREFSTKPNSRNKLEQYGDTAGYCRDKLLLNSFGTNRQVIGIGGNTGKPIVVYVDVEPLEGQPKSSVKLPTLTFTQILGSWQSSFRTSNLKLGRNSLVFPDIQTQGYSVFIEKGGPIHISNPYTYETQRGHVTIYIEGGYIYPVFHKDDDENSFRIILQNYYNRLNDPNDTDITVDAFEAVSDHVMTSCSCTLAYNVYINEGYSPQENIDRWDNFLGKLLAFGGIPFDENDPKFNIMNGHVRQNFRTVQPYAGFFAFAWTEMIGLPDTGTHRHCVYLTVPGWAFAHEFGHTVDKKGRIWGENTNNMWAMYNIFMMNREIYDRIPITAVSQNLASDFSDYVTHKDGTYMMGSNPNVWWILEGCKPGYWADSENSFIYEESDRDENGNSIIDVTERMIYYASLSFGHNMSTYFERWGFCMDRDPVFNVGNRWNYESSTENFRNLMNQAKSEGRIDDEVKKHWYINLDQYEYLFDHDNKLTQDAHCYDTTEYITPVSISKNGDSNIILLPPFKCEISHLCYEVQSFINNEWKVLGVTYSQIFTDNFDYQGATPQYRIYAYDRLLDHTGDPPNNFEPSNNEGATCRIGDTHYDTLNDAVEASVNDDTIILLKSFMLQQLTLNKKIKIIPDENLEEPITITKVNPGDLIVISGLGTGSPNIQIGDNSRVKIIFDGGGFKQAGTIIKIGGTKKLYLYNIELRNNVNSNDGGAMTVDHNAHVEMVNCLVEGCSSSKCGGGVYLCGGQQNYVHSELHINNVIFRRNSCTQDGGAIDCSGLYGYSRLVSSSDAVFENNVAGRNGGAIYAVKYQQLAGSVFEGNQAQNGGAIYIHCSSFEFKICSSNFSNNIATKGTDIYLQSGKLLLNAGIFEGMIHKVTGTTIRFNKWSSNEASIPDFTDATFSIDLPNGGNPLIDIIDSQYTSLIEDEMDSFTVQNGYARFEENKIIAYPSQSTITAIFNGQTFSFVVPYGDFILPSTFEGFSEDYSITGWKKDSVTYNTGDTIFINQDCTFEIIALKYCTLTIVYHDKQQILKIVPNTYYYMPMETPDKETVFGWECSDGNYYAYADPVLVTTDLTFTAVLMKKVTVTLEIGDNIETYQLNYNDFFTLPVPPENHGGLTFKYYYSDDNKYQPGEIISIVNDIKFTAYYSNTISVVYIAGLNEETREYQQNQVINLHLPGIEDPDKPNSKREFIYWDIDNVKYYPFYEYTVVRNIQATANYRLLDKETPITIIYQIPNVLSEYPHFVNGTTTRTETYSYLENISLPDEDYFSKEPYGLGYDRNTSRENLFDYWLINGKRYNGSETFGVTETFTAVLVTKLSTKGLPSETPTATPPETPTASNLPSETPLPSDTPTPEPTQVKTEPDVSDVDRVSNLITMNLDCKIMNGKIKINLKCGTCLIKEYMWFTIFFENGQINDVQYDDRDMYFTSNRYYKLDYYVKREKIVYNAETDQLKFDTGSQYILLMDGQVENNLKCYPPPSPSPAATETPSKSPTPKATMVHDYSNKEFTGKMSTIILDELYSNSNIEHTKFTDITLENDDCEYLIIVQKQMQFNDVHFLCHNSHIGAIKIDFTGDVTITNCVFTGCSVSNGNGNAILIAENSENTQKIIQNSNFNSCGTNGYVVYANQAVVLTNNEVTFEDKRSACGSFMIRKSGSTITNCNIKNNRAKGAINYNPVDTVIGSQFIIEQCTIENCEGVGLYNNLGTLSPDDIIIRQTSFINCVNPEMSSANAIGFNDIADSFSLEVNGCVFRNCGTNGYIFRLAAMRVKENFLDCLISFTDVLFEFDSINTGSGIEINQIDRKVLIHNCTFKNLLPNIDTDDMVSAIYSPSLNEIIIEQSKFLDCGGAIISIDEQNAEIIVQNCTFSSDQYSCGSPLFVRKESITLIGNTFINSNMIQIQTKILDNVQFKLIENTFTGCTSGSLINVIDGFQTKPIIERNIFDNINVDSELFSFTVTVDSNSIDFINNTFRDVTTKYGGFGGRIEYPNSESETPIHIKFTQCYFLSNTQRNRGGAFLSCEIQNNHNTELIFNQCEFENNKASGFGGALYIDCLLDVTIESCNFYSNLGGDGQGAAIYIAANDALVKISACNFKDNADFEDNKLDGFAIRSLASSIEISECIIEYTDINTAIGGLQVESQANSVSVTNCNFVKCSGAEGTSFVIECQNSIVFSNNHIDQCSYDQNLGKIYILGDSTEQTINSCNFTNNIITKSSPTSGLLVEKRTAGNLHIVYDSCEFKSNTASVESGGAISVKAEISVTMNKCTFSNNNAELNGGALVVSSVASISILNSEFLDNRCNKRGGAIYFDYNPITEPSYRLLDESAYCTITSCKFERNLAAEYGNAIFVNEARENAVYQIQNNQFIDNYYEQSNAGYVIVASFYIINVDQNTYNNQNTNIPINKFFLLSTIPSQSPSQSPSQTPHPTITTVPGTNMNYINKEYITTIPPCVGTENQIQVQSDRDINQISGCRFININHNKDYFIRIKKEIPFFDNYFELNDLSLTRAPAPIWTAYLTRLTVTRCTFINVFNRNKNDGNVFSNTNAGLYLTIESCTFRNCGSNRDTFIFNFKYSRSALKIMRSTIEFTDLSRSCKVINNMNEVHYIVVNGSTFDGCAQNAFQFTICTDTNFAPSEPFQFNDNVVKNIQGQFLNGNNLRNTPIIIGNTFQDARLNGEFLIHLSHNQQNIEISKTLFTNITTGGNNFGGGIATTMPFSSSDSTEVTFTLNKCQFVNNEALQASSSVTDGHYNGDGGAFHYGYDSSIINTNMKFIDCSFKQNKAYRHGGALSLQTAGSVIIQNCIFEENAANNKGTASSELLYENHYSKKNSGCGGAIYINPTFNANGQDYHMTSIEINGCLFIKNKAFNGYAIYIEGDDLDIPFVITGNDFTNNFNENDSQSKGSIIASEITTLNKEEIENNNDFTNDELATDAVKFAFVGHNGIPIDEVTPTQEEPTTEEPEPATPTAGTSLPDSYVEDVVLGDSNYTENHGSRVEKVISSDEHKNVRIVLVASEFNGKINDDGGAVHLINCGLKCESTHFDECKSNNGGGGAIYIKNSEELINDINLKGLVFRNCQSQYGGAVYIYSSSRNNMVSILQCEFYDNVATLSSSTNGLHGGSSVFLSTRKGKVRKCIFNGGGSGDSQFKLYNNFDNNDNLRYLSNDEDLSISDCKFELGYNTKCSIFYVGGIDGCKLNLNNCVFSGKLNTNAHFIDGQMIDKNSPKLLIQSCKFACSVNKALNNSPNNDFFSMNLKEQEFEFDQSSDAKKPYNDNWKLITIIAASAAAIVIILVAIALIIKKKNSASKNEQNEVEMSVEQNSIYDNALLNQSLI